MNYYLYTHTRLDTNQVFYVGIGRTYKLTNFERAHARAKRSPEWKQVYEDCQKQIKIDVVETFDKKELCTEAEIKLIAFYGRKLLGGLETWSTRLQEVINGEIRNLFISTS